MADTFARVKEIVLHAHELSAERRAAYLTEVCGEDAALREEVQALLDHEGADFSVLSPGGAVRFMTPDVAAALEGAPSAVPDVIGPYRIGAVLGEGGMGTVYRAEQLRPLRRDVALKLVRRGLDTDRIVRRFEAERQTLARMDHPAIARVLDAGASDDGRPYFVMELVEGVPIVEYAETRHLPTRGRLELFQAVCAGVQHAHQKGIIHRDLKPSNILVRDQDGAPSPRIIDFGIAKAVGDDAGASLARTQPGVFIGTPEYSSPEQAGVIDADMDTRTDVYSLGVVLYELLTARRPYEFRTPTPSELQRVLGTSPARPSVASGRRHLSGDLDNIVLKAMARAPADRYSSVEQLADDVGRHLSGLPVRARAATWHYRTAKFVRRHAVGVAAGTAVSLAILGLAIVMTVQSARLTAERNRALEAESRARQEAATAGSVSQFLVGLFNTSDPRESRGADLTAREVLDRGVTSLRSELESQPAVRARLLTVMGSVYYNLGLETEALALQEEAIAIGRRFGAPPADLAKSLNALAQVLQNRQAYDRAEALYREALALNREAYGNDHVEVATNVSNLGALFQVQGQAEPATRFTREALDLRRKVLGEDHPHVGFSLNNLAVLIHVLNADPAGAEPLYREALELRARVLGASHPDTVNSRSNLAAVLLDLERHEEAEPLLRTALADMRRQLPAGHQTISRPLLGLGTLLTADGRLVEGESALREAVAIRRGAFAPGHWRTAHAENLLGANLLAQGKLGEAVPLLEESAQRLTELLGPGSPYTQEARENLARVSARR